MRREDFDAWRRDPVTKFIFTALDKARDREKAEWVRQSWDAGQCDPMQLTELRAKAEAITDLLANDYETWIEWSKAE